MAASILCQDIVAICLCLAEGNLDLAMEVIIRRAESYQAKHYRHFGISTRDFRNLLRNLFLLEMKVTGADEETFNIRLVHTINYILKYQYAHFNDEGELWIRSDELQKEESYPPLIKYWYGYDPDEYLEKVRMKQKMIRFFESLPTVTHHLESIQQFMEELNIKNNILYFCSRSGILS